METFFISRLDPLLKALAGETDVYIPKKYGEHYLYVKFESASATEIEFNTIRACTPVKEFLFPLRELAARLPTDLELKEIKPFTVFGLKECDLHAIEILDKVFKEDDFEDALYVKRRERMFLVSTDCTEAGETCFCNLFGGKGFPIGGSDLNVSKIKDGFLVETVSQKGKDFISRHSGLFADAPKQLVVERDENRAKVRSQLEKQNSRLAFNRSIKSIIENCDDSELFDSQAENCIECQACTRVCPTCHCFYLDDAKQKDYFVKMKIWDSCMRMAYAAVAGGANPRKVLGDRIKHRLMHKFAYFLDRYGIDMCVGCGRCVDADAGGMDLREVLIKLNQSLKGKA